MREDRSEVERLRPRCGRSPNSQSSQREDSPKTIRSCCRKATSPLQVTPRAPISSRLFASSRKSRLATIVGTRSRVQVSIAAVLRSLVANREFSESFWIRILTDLRPIDVASDPRGIECSSARRSIIDGRCPRGLFNPPCLRECSRVIIA